VNEEEYADIRVRQIKASEAHTTSKPSEVTDIFWIFAKRQAADEYPPATDNSGKWLLFVPVEQIDATWSVVKQATEEGRLGSSSKVATAKPNSHASNPAMKVICVYTYDWTAEADVRRIRQELRTMGFLQKIAYKANEDTRQGRYSNSGGTRISKYYE